MRGFSQKGKCRTFFPPFVEASLRQDFGEDPTWSRRFRAAMPSGTSTSIWDGGKNTYIGKGMFLRINRFLVLKNHFQGVSKAIANINDIIAPNSLSPLDQVGVPQSIAMNLTCLEFFQVLFEKLTEVTHRIGAWNVRVSKFSLSDQPTAKSRYAIQILSPDTIPFLLK
jgi:hypothetical protein